MTEATAPHFLPDRFVQGIPTLKAGDGAGPLHDLVVALHLRMLDHDFVIGDEVLGHTLLRDCRHLVGKRGGFVVQQCSQPRWHLRGAQGVAHDECILDNIDGLFGIQLPTGRRGHHGHPLADLEDVVELGVALPFVLFDVVQDAHVDDLVLAGTEDP